MLGLKSEKGKLRKAGKHWLYLGTKVYHYRRDELNEADLTKLVNLIEETRRLLKDKGADQGKLRLTLEELEKHLNEVGGSHYPRTSVGENIDFFFYVLIVYLGFTAFFIKPFKIPTNSMWPTYSGMTVQIWENEEDKPSLPERIWRKGTLWASRYDIVAPADGELLLPVQKSDGVTVLHREKVRGWDLNRFEFSIFPTSKERYTFFVGDVETNVRVPEAFRLEDEVLGEVLFGSRSLLYQKMHVYSTSPRYSIRKTARDGKALHCIRTGLHFKKGDVIASFDILTGDMLFVDRLSYHFVSPKVGDGFVFRTNGIKKLEAERSYVEQFYIKRLCGVPGDKVSIKDGALLIDGEPAKGSIAFDKNAAKEGEYEGYVNDYDFRFDDYVYEVPEDHYLPMGDNSDNSKDGRFFGAVHEGNIVGKPVLIYYPFTSRTGIAQ